MPIKKYRKALTWWIITAIILFLIWATMLTISSYLNSHNYFNNTNSVDTFYFIGIGIYGSFVGWVCSGIYWFIYHLSKKENKEVSNAIFQDKA